MIPGQNTLGHTGGFITGIKQDENGKFYFLSAQGSVVYLDDACTEEKVLEVEQITEVEEPVKIRIAPFSKFFPKKDSNEVRFHLQKWNPDTEQWIRI